MMIWSDLKHGIRVLRRNPGTTLAALLTFALGIGANAALYSVIYAVLLRPLPFEDPSRLVIVWNEYDGNPSHNSPPDYNDRLQGSETMESLAALVLRDVNLTGRGDPLRVQTAAITASMFPTLGVEPALGRVFRAEEDIPGKNHVVVLSHGSWQRWFGGDPEVLGSTVNLNGTVHDVIGVMPPQFSLPIAKVDAWQPIALTAQNFTDEERGNEFLWVVGRMKPGVNMAQAEAEMDTIAANVITSVPDRADFLSQNSWGAQVVPLREEFVADVRLALVLLLGAVGMVLLIACANVASLLLARGSARLREFAIRSALGASARRMISQSLTESALLAFAGGAIGLLVAPWALDILVVMAPGDLPFLDTAGMSLPVLFFAAGLSLVTGLLAGLLPALQTLRGRRLEALADGGTGGRTTARGRLRQILVVAEVAIACVLLAGAGLLLRSFQGLLEVDPGFQTESRLVAKLSLPASRYNDLPARVTFARDLTRKLEALPGVRSVGAAHNLPLEGRNHTASFQIEGHEPAPGQKSPGGIYRAVTPGYFATMGIPLQRGRLFDEREDAQSASPAVIVDQRAAESFWPGEDPIGKRLEFDQWREVIGVVAAVKDEGLHVLGKGAIYVPHAQYPLRDFSFVIATDLDPRSLVDGVRASVLGEDPQLPIYGITTIEEQVQRSVSPRRYPMLLLTVFAGLGLLLAAVGIYSVIGYSVGQRTREIGTRMALGATPGNILGAILRQGAQLATIGIMAGILGSVAVSRLLTSMLYGISPVDPATYVMMPAIVVVVSLLAAFLPARRATRVNPVDALRYE